MKLYTTKEIQEITEVSTIQLSQWINTGVIEPVVDKSDCGGICMFNLENLIDINLCKKLNELRLPIHVIASSLKQLHRFGSSKYRFGFSKKKDPKKSFWEYYWRTYETRQWFLVIINAQKCEETNRIDTIFLKAYRESGITPPEDTKDIFLVFPLPKEKLEGVLEFIQLAIIIKLDEIVDKVIKNFLSEDLVFDRVSY